MPLTQERDHQQVNNLFLTYNHPTGVLANSASSLLHLANFICLCHELSFSTRVIRWRGTHKDTSRRHPIWGTAIPQLACKCPCFIFMAHPDIDTLELYAK